MKKLIALALSALLLFALLTGCAQKEAEPAAAEPAQPAAEAPAEAPADEETSAAEPAEEPAEEPAPAEPALPDGVYTAEFDAQKLVSLITLSGRYLFILGGRCEGGKPFAGAVVGEVR